MAAGYGAGALRNLMPHGDAANKAAQLQQMARSGMSAPPAEPQKTTSGAVMSGLSGVMAGKKLAGMLPTAAAETTGTVAAGEGIASMGAGSVASDMAMTGIAPALASGVAETAVPMAVAETAAPVVAAGVEAGAAGLGAAGLTGLAAVAPWAVGALALGSYLFS